MMSNSLWVSDRARGALEVLEVGTQWEIKFNCDLCSKMGIACIVTGTDNHPIFSFPLCVDGYMCIPPQQPLADKNYEALRSVIALLRSASFDCLGSIQQDTGNLYTHKPFQNFDYKSFLLKQSHRGNVLIPHAAMKRITSLYQTTSDYADNFAVVDKGKQKQKTYQCLD